MTKSKGLVVTSTQNSGEILVLTIDMNGYHLQEEALGIDLLHLVQG